MNWKLAAKHMLTGMVSVVVFWQFIKTLTEMQEAWKRYLRMHRIRKQALGGSLDFNRNRPDVAIH